MTGAVPQGPRRQYYAAAAHWKGRPGGEGAMDRRRATVIAVFAVAILVTLSAVLYWEVRPLTIQEVFERDGWQAGDVRDLEGTITAIRRENTSYGPRVLLELDGYMGLVAYGDPNGTYAVGDRFATTMHFAGYSFNGNAGVWAPELFAPVPGLLTSIGVVMDSVSSVSGMYLAFNGTDAQGWTTYDVVTKNGDAYPLHALNATLRKGVPVMDWPSEAQGRSLNSAATWIVLGGVEYVRASGGYTNGTLVDRMPSLADGTSANGTIRVADTASNGFLDDGDALRVRLNSTGGDNAWQVYYLEVGGMMRGGGYASGGKYILDGPRGPYDLRQGGYPLRLRHAGDQAGPAVTSTIEVLDAAAPLVASADVNFTVTGGPSTFSGRVSELPITASGITVEYRDAESNGLLSAGDTFVLSGLSNRTSYSLELSASGRAPTALEWIAGYGEVVGRIPDLRLSVGTGPPYPIRADPRWWHQELALSGHVAVSLWENSNLLVRNVTLANGTLGTYPNGSLAFLDADGDGFLSSGDSFTLRGFPGAAYRLEVSVLWGYRTFEAAAGP